MERFDGMKIYLDNIVFTIQKAGGISIYWFELLKNLMNSNEKFKIIEQKSNNKNIFRNNLDINSELLLREGGLPIKVLRYLPLRVAIDEYSIFHSSYYRIAKLKNVANIVTVHDFIYERFSGNILPKYIHVLQKKYAVKNADGIICVSENTKNDLLKFIPEAENADIKVIYHGASSEYYHLDKKHPINSDFKWITEKRYIIFLGGRSGHKNFDIAVKVVSRLLDTHLLIIGGGMLSSMEKDLLDKDLEKRYIKLNNIDNSQLNIFYNYALCLLYPSTYEGFGIPIIEAMSAGCPVVSTVYSSIPEVAGDAGLLVNSIDEEALIDKIKSLENESYRSNVIELGYRQARKFSWLKCYNETLEFYKKVFNKKFNSSNR